MRWLAYWVSAPFIQRLPELPWDELAVALCDNAGIIRSSVKKAVFAQSDTLQRWDAFQQRQRVQGSFHGVQWVRAHVSQPGSITCPECCVELESGSHLATHMAHVHGYVSSAREYAAGTVCKWCLKQYWSVERLRTHLSAGSQCLAMLVASLSPLNAAQMELVDKQHCDQRHASKRLGGAVDFDRLPPVQCCGPRRPVPLDLAESLSVELHSMSSFARAALWRSACAVQKLGLADLGLSLEALEPVPLREPWHFLRL